ncbi:hypothetical protein DEO72_LG2g3205 [Vigna unguiculata]|uniref:Uncharacterized protein n=1 Tax=Vigna unguiculata TaxID=3917 RepID=A0A4D6L335_VIGUN|nr:hypothetical protein DEO72_LG2g3205 [Vigna unguiculata]
MPGNASTMAALSELARPTTATTELCCVVFSAHPAATTISTHEQSCSTSLLARTVESAAPIFASRQDHHLSATVADLALPVFPLPPHQSQ